jgi:hypothetical protein
MTHAGHLSISYILARIALSVGFPLEGQEILLLLIAGILPDADFLLSFLHSNAGDVHHRFPTHTPFGLFCIWVLLSVLLPHHSYHFYVILLITFFVHLVLDDVGYWLCKLRLQKISPYRQIQWFFPFERFPEDHYKATRGQIFKTYLRDARASVILELTITSIALLLFFYGN